MSYGGVDLVEFDWEYGFFYVHREGDDGGYWNRYSISDEEHFQDWIDTHSDKIEITDISDKTDNNTNDNFDSWMDYDDPNEDFGSWG